MSNEALHTRQLVELVRRLNGGVTVIEIGRELEDLGIDTAGTESIYLGDDQNLILWTGMSTQFSVEVIALKEHPEVEIHPTSVLTYLVDGGALTLPVAQRPPRGGYKSPHWSPIVFNLT